MLFKKRQPYGADKQYESQNVVPLQLLVLKHHVGNNHEHGKAYAFLYHFQLYELERAAVSHEAYSVGRHLTAIFEEGNAP